MVAGLAAVVHRRFAPPTVRQCGRQGEHHCQEGVQVAASIVALTAAFPLTMARYLVCWGWRRAQSCHQGLAAAGGTAGILWWGVVA